MNKFYVYDIKSLRNFMKPRTFNFLNSKTLLLQAYWSGKKRVEKYCVRIKEYHFFTFFKVTYYYFKESHTYILYVKWLLKCTLDAEKLDLWNLRTCKSYGVLAFKSNHYYRSSIAGLQLRSVLELHQEISSLFSLLCWHIYYVDMNEQIIINLFLKRFIHSQFLLTQRSKLSKYLLLHIV